MLKRLKNADQFIKVPLTKGAYLLLTYNEYVAGLARGKREKRTQRLSVVRVNR